MPIIFFLRYIVSACQIFFEENYPTIETLRMEVRNMESPPGGSQGGPPGLKYDRDHMAKAQKLTSLKRT